MIVFKAPNGICGITAMAMEEFRIIDEDELPKDWYFRNAWIYGEKSITVDMEKAKSLHMDNIRIARNHEFVKLGFPEKLNTEVEALLSDGVKKQLKDLRDITKTVDLSEATTLDEIKAIWPDNIVRGV